MTSSRLTPWAMLALISAGFIALTLNWFDIASAFPLVAAEFHVGIGSLSYLISVYIIGYGLAHVPGGMLATAIGMKRTLAAVGGFFIPIIFGHLVSGTSFGTGWIFLAAISFAFALVGLFGRNPGRAAVARKAAVPADAARMAANQ
ncbi:MAG: hypothetical protein ACRDNS_25940 [Trebonia sp.]